MTLHLGDTTFTCNRIGCFTAQTTSKGIEDSVMTWRSLGTVAGFFLVIVLLIATIRLAIKRIVKRKAARKSG